MGYCPSPRIEASEMIDNNTLISWEEWSKQAISNPLDYSLSDVCEAKDKLQLIEALRTERGEAQQAHAMVEDLSYRLGKELEEVKKLGKALGDLADAHCALSKRIAEIDWDFAVDLK